MARFRVSPPGRRFSFRDAIYDSDPETGILEVSDPDFCAALEELSRTDSIYKEEGDGVQPVLEESGGERKEHEGEAVHGLGEGRSAGVGVRSVELEGGGTAPADEAGPVTVSRWRKKA
jgi:hypothetical protein